MSLIETISPDDATGDLRDIYVKTQSIRGSVGKNAIILSSSPEILKWQSEFVGYYMNHSTLSFSLLATIRIWVSKNHNCLFCIDYNTALLVNKAGWTIEEVASMKENHRLAKLNEKDLAMLDFVLKAVNHAHDVDYQDIESLRKIGWSDADMLDAVNHGARMVAADIVFNTFKIEAFES